MILSLLLMALPLGPGPCLAEPVRLITGDWAPYCSSDPEEPGITTELVLAAFRASGAETTLEFMPWARCERMIQDGEDDALAVFPYVRTPTREKFALFSLPMLMERTYLYSARGALPGFDFTGYEALRNYRVGTLNGFVHQELFADHKVPAQVVKSNTVGLKMLLLGRLDLFPVNDLVAKRVLNKCFRDKMDQFSRTETPMYEVALHLMVSRKNPQADRILSLFAEGLALIRADGTMKRIIAHYE